MELMLWINPKIKLNNTINKIIYFSFFFFQGINNKNAPKNIPLNSISSPIGAKIKLDIICITVIFIKIGFGEKNIIKNSSKIILIKGNKIPFFIFILKLNKFFSKNNLFKKIKNIEKRNNIKLGIIIF